MVRQASSIRVDCGMPTVRVCVEIAAPIEACFDLARDLDFHQESMAATRERAVAGDGLVSAGKIGLGQEVLWRARHLGVMQTLRSRIVEFEPPSRFVDEQVRGAFASLRHEHTFEALSGSRTRVVDVLTFRAPLGVLGRIAERAFLTRYLTRFLEGHLARMKERLEK